MDTNLGRVIGYDGKQIELSRDSLYIKWRYVGDAVWKNLIALNDLKVGLPKGGKTDQVLAKLSNNDWDYVWKTPESGGGSVDTVQLASVTTAPVAPFPINTKYYNANDNTIYRATEENTWENADTEEPVLGAFYIYDDEIYFYDQKFQSLYMVKTIPSTIFYANKTMEAGESNINMEVDLSNSLILSVHVNGHFQTYGKNYTISTENEESTIHFDESVDEDSEVDVVYSSYMELSGGGGSGTSDYNQLSNKPKINGIEVKGNKSANDLGLQTKIDSNNKLDASLIDNLPQVNNSLITIKQGSTTKGTFTLNQSNSTTITLDEGGSSAVNIEVNKTFNDYFEVKDLVPSDELRMPLGSIVFNIDTSTETNSQFIQFHYRMKFDKDYTAAFNSQLVFFPSWYDAIIAIAPTVDYRREVDTHGDIGDVENYTYYEWFQLTINNYDQYKTEITNTIEPHSGTPEIANNWFNVDITIDRVAQKTKCVIKTDDDQVIVSLEQVLPWGGECKYGLQGTTYEGNAIKILDTTNTFVKVDNNRYPLLVTPIASADTIRVNHSIIEDHAVVLEKATSNKLGLVNLDSDLSLYSLSPVSNSTITAALNTKTHVYSGNDFNPNFNVTNLNLTDIIELNNENQRILYPVTTETTPKITFSYKGKFNCEENIPYNVNFALPTYDNFYDNWESSVIGPQIQLVRTIEGDVETETLTFFEAWKNQNNEAIVVTHSSANNDPMVSNKWFKFNLILDHSGNNNYAKLQILDAEDDSVIFDINAEYPVGANGFYGVRGRSDYGTVPLLIDASTFVFGLNDSYWDALKWTHNDTIIDMNVMRDLVNGSTVNLQRATNTKYGLVKVDTEVDEKSYNPVANVAVKKELDKKAKIKAEDFFNATYQVDNINFNNEITLLNSTNRILIPMDSTSHPYVHVHYRGIMNCGQNDDYSTLLWTPCDSNYYTGWEITSIIPQVKIDRYVYEGTRTEKLSILKAWTDPSSAELVNTDPDKMISNNWFVFDLIIDYENNKSTVNISKDDGTILYTLETIYPATGTGFCGLIGGANPSMNIDTYSFNIQINEVQNPLVIINEEVINQINTTSAIRNGNIIELKKASQYNYGVVKLGSGIVNNDGVISVESQSNLLPDQTGQSGKFLTTDGTNLSWGTPQGGGGSSIQQYDYEEQVYADGGMIASFVNIDLNTYLSQITDDHAITKFSYDGTDWYIGDSNPSVVDLTDYGISISGYTPVANDEFYVYSFCLRNRTDFTFVYSGDTVHCAFLNGNLILKSDYYLTDETENGQTYKKINFNNYTLRASDKLSTL